jgi:glycosyltransferase involved in cell wall biosynthesis
LVASLGLEQRVRLIGPVADVSSLLHAADLSVFSSWHEGTPNAVLESMAAGRAVVATDIAGCRDTLGEGYAGLVERENAEGMAEKIVELTRNEERRNELGDSLKHRAEDEFRVSRMCERSCRAMLHLPRD